VLLLMRLPSVVGVVVGVVVLLLLLRRNYVYVGSSHAR
jgi:hypothetical protein